MLIRSIVTLLGVALAAALGTAAYVIASATIPAALIPVSFVTGDYGLYLIAAGVLGLGIGLILLQRRNHTALRLLGALIALVSVLGAVAAFFPQSAAWREADRVGADMSVLNYLTEGLNTGGADDSLAVPYATVDGTPLLLEPMVPTDYVDRPRPAVVWVHGGGFTSGDRGQSPRWREWLRNRGYAVFSVDYRLAPPPRWDQAAADVKCAIGWIRQQARQFSIDPDRVMAAGASAGGNLALLAAYSDDRITPSCPVGDTSVSAVTAFYPPTDLAAGWRDSGDPDYTHQVLTDYLGGPPESVPDRYAAASPLTYVRPGLPPTLLLHGTRDHVVPFDQSRALTEALEGAGVPHTLQPLPYAEHGYDVAWGVWPTQISRHVFAEFLDQSFPVP
ncbi:alpha/beta hydrolase fold domain-containing protein [Nocardia takedensis]|uniref:alpha/beta hydrolase n=1 Tax=Nocardia takedensis TaxID=259390 RepID=UPI000312F123|nr:alpha/beta hydrolase [Nocardia takedensis]